MRARPERTHLERACTVLDAADEVSHLPLGTHAISRAVVANFEGTDNDVALATLVALVD